MSTFRYTKRTFARELALLAAAAIFCIPMYLVLTISLKTTSQAILSPFSVPMHLHFSNYPQAYDQSADSGAPNLGKAALNSAMITIGTVFCLIVIGSVAAYTLVRRPSKLSTGLYFLFVLGYILPFQLALLPVYVSMRHLSLIGNVPGAILLYTGLFMPISVFLYTGFVRVLPRDYEEAAQVDGAGLLRTFLRVIFPLLMPITGTVAVLTGLFVWNDFFVALIFLSGSQAGTLPLTIYGFVGAIITQWNLIFAAIAMALTPMLLFFIFAQKQLMRGFAGGIRG
jgi:raffinose/stachyose/melibiose transport system permease protein